MKPHLIPVPPCSVTLVALVVLASGLGAWSVAAAKPRDSRDTAPPETAPRVEHTWLFEEGAWDATGTYVSPEGERLPMVGKTEITHTDEGWVTESWMEADSSGRARQPEAPRSGPVPIPIKNRATVRPFEPGELNSTWDALNPALGDLHGQVAVVGDSILYDYTSEDGKNHGTEVLRKIDDDHYEKRTVFFNRDSRVSSWVVRLHRTHKPKPAAEGH